MKTLLALGLAVVVNLLLFVLMEEMVVARVPGLEVGALGTLSLDIVTLPEVPPPAEVPPREPEEPDAHAEPTLASPEVRVAASLRAMPAAPAIAPVVPAAPTFELRGAPTFGDFAGEAESLAPLQPTVRVDPEYPRRALARKIEGSVIVGFTIQPDGSTADLEVLDARPAGVFDRSALEAVERWRFAPRSEPRRDQTKFEFELADE